MAKNFGRVNVSITASTGGLTAGLSRASSQLKGFATQTQTMGGRLTAMAASFVGLGRGATMAAIGVKALGMAIKSLLAPLLIVGSLVSVFAAIGRSASSLDEAGKTARRLGMSMQSFQNLGQVASEAGVSVEQMGTLLTIMSRNLGNLANGSSAAQKAFGRLGLSLSDLQGISPERQFELISQRIMALPTAAERTAAAMAIFGGQGASAMGLISDASTGAVAEIAKLRTQLGMNLTDAQVKGIDMMNDALGRLSMPLQGFIAQFLAELAPAVTAVSRLFVQFFAESTSGFSIAQTLANGLVQSLRMVVGAATLLTGIFQVFQALGSQIGQMFSEVFAIILSGVTRVMRSMAQLAEAAGFTGLAASLAEGSRGAAELARGARQMGAMYGDAASSTFNQAVENMANPFGAFDREFANAQREASANTSQTTAAVASDTAKKVSNAIAVSMQELKALVVGTSGGESFRNSILRGSDPRLTGADAAKETADNTERTADAVEDLHDALAASMGGGLGLASITV